MSFTLLLPRSLRLPKVDCKSRRIPRPSRLAFEHLEERALLSTINWTNKNALTNNFGLVFGTNADLARRVVEAAVDSWANVITSFHTSTNVFNVNISMVPNKSGQGGQTQVNTSENGIPTSATMTIGSGADGHGSYLFLDPTVPADPHQFNPVNAYYLGSNQNAFASNATNDTDLRDLYQLVLHEMGHAVGFSSIDTGGHPLLLATTPYAHDVSNPTGQPAGDDYVFQGPDVTTLLTSDNAGTSNAGAPIHADYYDHSGTYNGVTYIGSDDLMVPGTGNQIRRLISDSDVLVLKDIYGYDVVQPDALDNFYIGLDLANGTLTLRGNQFVDSDRGYGPSADTITLRTSANQLTVSVNIGTPTPGAVNPNPLTKTIPGIALLFINTINIYPGAGGTSIVIDDSANTGADTGISLKDSAVQPGWGVISGLGSVPNINYQYSGTSSLTIHTSTASGDVVRVSDAAAPIHIINHGAATVNIGTDVHGVQNHVTIDNTAAKTTITVDDSTDTTAQNFTIGTNTFDSGWGFVHDTNIPNFSIDFRSGATSSLRLDTGAASGNHVSVWQTASAVIINAHGRDDISLGDANHNLSGIGSVSVNGNGSTTLEVNDAGNAKTPAQFVAYAPVSTMFAIDAGRLTRLAVANVSLVQPPPLPPLPIPNYPMLTTVAYGGLASLTVDGGAAVQITPTRYGILNTSQANAVTINAHGNDAVTIGDANHNLSGIGSVTIVGNVSTTLEVNDAGNAKTPAQFAAYAPVSTMFTIDAGRLTRLAVANVSLIQPPPFPPLPIPNYPILTTINYSSVADLTLNGGSGGTTFNVMSTPGPQFVPFVGLVFKNTTINCAGGDTVNVGDGNGVQDILGSLTVNSTIPDFVTLNLNDQNDARGQTVTMATGSIVGLAPADIDYGPDSLANLNVYTGTGGNAIDIESTPAPVFVPRVGIAYTQTNIVGNGLGDAVVVGGTARLTQNIHGPIDVTNPSGATILIVDDSNGTIGRSVNLSDGVVWDPLESTCRHASLSIL